MFGDFFAMFAFSPDKIALMVNYLSVFSSAFTVLFLFWSLTMILKKVVSTAKEISKNQNIIKNERVANERKSSFCYSFFIIP